MLRISLGLCLALCFACASPTGGRFGEYETIIRAEWKVAQDRLAVLGVERSSKVPPDICKFEAREGRITTDVTAAGWTNGLFYPSSFRIVWNVETPGVLRHEAGHAILLFLDYDCWDCYEHECGPCPR